MAVNAGLETKLLHLEVLNQRRAGTSYEQIAVNTGYTASYCQNLVSEFLKSRSASLEDIAQLRSMELCRLDRIVERIWPMLDPEDPEVRVNLKAVDQYLKVSKARREITGMDVRSDDATGGSATQVNVNVYGDKSSVEATQRFLHLADMISDDRQGIEPGDYADIEPELGEIDENPAENAENSDLDAE